MPELSQWLSDNNLDVFHVVTKIVLSTHDSFIYTLNCILCLQKIFMEFISPNVVRELELTKPYLLTLRPYLLTPILPPVNK